MSGASGKVPAAIHVSPEAAAGGPLARLRDGDIVRLDAVAGTLTVLAPDFDTRPPVTADLSGNEFGHRAASFSPPSAGPSGRRYRGCRYPVTATLAKVAASGGDILAKMKG